MSGKIKNLDVYLAEVYKHFVALKDNDLKKSQEVFKSVFEQVKQKMGEQCNYFNQYASQVMYAGSVYDGTKVSKMDEFDINIVIRLPINYENGIVLENDLPGFVKMKITEAFDNLDKQKEWGTRHKVTRDWRDSDKYFLQNKFRHWMHSIIQKALNEMDGRAEVDGVVYYLKYKKSGPAYTLNIRDSGDDEFTLDIDLVPVIRFLSPRWPEGYRCVAGSQIREWQVVPKPNKSVQDEQIRNRCWRLSFQDYEREIMKGCQQLKNTIRLVKKLRNAMGLKAIASYYIKTLFLWKIVKIDKKCWETKLSATFRSMVEELHNAIVAKNIPYFWNERNNLIADMKPTVQKIYVNKLKAVLNSIDANDVDKVVEYLLTTDELHVFKQSKFYQAQPCSTFSYSNNGSQQETPNTVAVEKVIDNQLLVNLSELMKTLSEKLDALSDKVSALDVRLTLLEMDKKTKKVSAVDDLNGISFGVNTLTMVKCQSHKEDPIDNVEILTSS